MSKFSLNKAVLKSTTQNHIEVLPHTHEHGYDPKKTGKSADKDAEKRKPLCTVVRNVN